MKHLILLSILITVFATPVEAAKKGGGTMTQLKISSPAFAENGTIPAKYTCDGANVNPPLKIENVPEHSKSLVLIVDDPDAPDGVFTHWVVWDIPPHTVEIQENTVPRESIPGRNDWRRNSYGGPCPPSGTHRYRFTLYALDTTVDLAGGSSVRQLQDAIEGHIVGQARLTGLYGKKGG